MQAGKVLSPNFKLEVSVTNKKIPGEKHTVVRMVAVISDFLKQQSLYPDGHGHGHGERVAVRPQASWGDSDNFN